MTTQDPTTNQATQPTIYPAPVLVEPPVPAAITPTQLIASILAEAEMTQAEMDALRVPARVDIGEARWEAGKPAPGSDDLFILFLFHGSQADQNDSHATGDVRVYATPISPVIPTEKRWRCYTLSRVTGTSLLELMPLEKFVEDIAGELVAVSGVHDAIIAENVALRDALEMVSEEAERFKLVGVQKIIAEAMIDIDGEEEDE